MRADTQSPSAQLRGSLATDLEIFACPQCRGKLQSTEVVLRCAACSLAYPLRCEIPDFILYDLRQSSHPVLRKSKLLDWLAPVYESRLWYSLVLKLVGGRRSPALPQLVELIREMLGDATGRLLDVACGPGTFGRRFATPACRVYGIDISLGMLQQGVAKARSEGVENIRFSRAQVECIPFASSSFDAAICSGSLHLFAHPAAALREIARALKPAAHMAVLTFTGDAGGMFKYRRIREAYRKRGVRVFGVAELEQLLRDAGFEHPRSRVIGSILLSSAHKQRLDAAR